jgi:hypothetical protein
MRLVHIARRAGMILVGVRMGLCVGIVQRRRTIVLKFKALTLIALAVMLAAQPAYAVRVAFRWTAPTTNADGTPLTDLAGFMMYWRRAERQAEGRESWNNSSNPANDTEKSIELEPGRWTVFVTALDADGNESDESNRVTVVVGEEVVEEPIDEIAPQPPVMAASCRVITEGSVLLCTVE